MERVILLEICRQLVRVKGFWLKAIEEYGQQIFFCWENVETLF
jgi:hypothetical protein